MIIIPSTPVVSLIPATTPMATKLTTNQIETKLSLDRVKSTVANQQKEIDHLQSEIIELTIALVAVVIYFQAKKWFLKQKLSKVMWFTVSFCLFMGGLFYALFIDDLQMTLQVLGILTVFNILLSLSTAFLRK